jgi:hypothetical protein
MSDWNVDDAGVAAKAAADARSEIDALRAANRDLQDWKDSNGQYGWPPFDGECE